VDSSRTFSAEAAHAVKIGRKFEALLDSEREGWRWCVSRSFAQGAEPRTYVAQLYAPDTGGRRCIPFTGASLEGVLTRAVAHVERTRAPGSGSVALMPAPRSPAEAALDSDDEMDLPLPLVGGGQGRKPILIFRRPAATDPNTFDWRIFAVTVALLAIFLFVFARMALGGVQ
jgi:hypothetical protein